MYQINNNDVFIPRYRSYVGPAAYYDLLAALQFSVLTLLGLREEHSVLDIGCGSLRVGRLLIPFLQKDKYYGIDPNGWLIEEGIKQELSNEILKIKKPCFNYNDSLTLDVFDTKFDYLLAISIFTHAPEDMIRHCLSEAERVMKDDALFIVTYKEGESSYKGTTWVDPGTISYTTEKMEEMIYDAGLKYISLDWKPNINQRWLVIAKQTKQSISPISIKFNI